MGRPANGHGRAVLRGAQRIRRARIRRCVLSGSRGCAEGNADILRLAGDLRLRIDACAGNGDHVVDHRRGVDRQVIHRNAAHNSSSMQRGFPLQEAAGGRSHHTILQGLPVRPAADGLLHIAGAGLNLVAGGARLHLDAAKPRQRSGIEDVAAIFVPFRGAQQAQLAGIPGADEDVLCRCWRS